MMQKSNSKVISFSSSSLAIYQNTVRNERNVQNHRLIKRIFRVPKYRSTVRTFDFSAEVPTTLFFGTFGTSSRVLLPGAEYAKYFSFFLPNKVMVCSNPAS